MKKVKFSKQLTDLILNGKKTSTWRLFDDKDLSDGDELILVNKENLENFANAVIVNLQEKKLGELEDSDWEGHERYESEEKMYQDFQSYYPDKKVDENTLVKIINFKIIKFLI